MFCGVELWLRHAYQVRLWHLWNIKLIKARLIVCLDRAVFIHVSEASS